MITIIGKILILLSITCGSLGLLCRPKFFLRLQSIAVVAALLALGYAFVTNDFSVQNVLFYSSTKQPLIYKIASLWGNHNASLLFFASLLSLVSCAASLSIQNDASIKVMSFFITLTMVIIYFVSNPFFHIPNIPPEGLGMNPVLQDMAIAMHPPMLYLGYVTYLVPYACFLGALCSGTLFRPLDEKQYTDLNYKNWVPAFFCMKTQDVMTVAYIFSKIALGFLTIGVSLGSWWAYRELGWGGYWFFDPVENISLIPWLVGVALQHSFMITMRNGTLLSATIALGLLNFLLIIGGVLVVRSGMLVSVHSFSSNVIYGHYILAAFTVIVIFTCWKYIASIKSGIGIPTAKLTFQERGIITGNAVIGAATLCLMIGTFFPLFYQAIRGVSISISNGYFHLVFLPLMVAIVILAIFMPHLMFGFKLKLNSKNSAMMLSHTGILVLAIGVALNSFLKEDIEFIGKIGDVVVHPNIKIKLQNIRYSEGSNYYRQIGEFWIETNNGETVILRPENRLYNVEKVLSAESDIYSFVARDVYAVLGSLEENGTLHANIYIRPWMSLIWLGMFLTAIGIFLSAAVGTLPARSKDGVIARR